MWDSLYGTGRAATGRRLPRLQDNPIASAGTTDGRNRFFPAVISASGVAAAAATTASRGDA
ncbi:MAG: hypothetical protein ACREF3_07930, partial [Acetobacteraceae bacterium]